MFVRRDIVYERIEFEGDANHSVQVSHFHGAHGEACRDVFNKDRPTNTAGAAPPVRDLCPAAVWRPLNAGKVDVGKDQRWRKCCRVRVRIVADSIQASEQVLEIPGDIHFAHWPADLSILNHVTAKPK